MDRAIEAKAKAFIAGRQGLDLLSGDGINEEIIEMYGPRMSLDDRGQLQISGFASPDAAVDEYMKARPQTQLNQPDTDLEAEVLRTGSLKAHGEYFKAVGKDAYQDFLQRTGAKPGQPSASVGDDKKCSAANPWSAASFASGHALRDQGHLVNTLVKKWGKAEGEKRAAQVAASAGCALGSVRPNPAYN